MKEEPLKRGPYSRNATDKEAYNLVDEHGMGRTTHPPDCGAGDSHGRNWKIYFNYNDWRVVNASADLWYFSSMRGWEYIGQRHPEVLPEDRPISRDHYSNSLLSLKLYEKRNGYTAPTPKIKEIVKCTGWRISKMARKTLSLHCWSHALLGNKFSELMYYLVEIFSLLLWYLPSHVLGSLIANYTEEVDQSEWVRVQLQNEPKYKTVISKIIYPSYAIQQAGWKLYVLEGFPLIRKFVKWLHRPMIGKTNYVQQMLFGMKVPRDKVEAYKAMKGGRWSGYLSNRNDRAMEVLDPQPTLNNIDVDTLRTLYNETQL